MLELATTEQSRSVASRAVAVAVDSINFLSNAAANATAYLRKAQQYSEAAKEDLGYIAGRVNEAVGYAQAASAAATQVAPQSAQVQRFAAAVELLAEENEAAQAIVAGAVEAADDAIEEGLIFTGAEQRQPLVAPQAPSVEAIAAQLDLSNLSADELALYQRIDAAYRR